jgi:peptide/nickel transport system permease protein
MRILRLIVRRLLLMVPSVFGVLAITFVITHVLPTNPVYLMLGPQASRAAAAELTRQLGYNQPVLVQFGDYLGQLVHGNLGFAWHTSDPVAFDLRARLPATLELIIVAMILAVPLSIVLGVIGARAQGRWPDGLVRVASLLGVAVPDFWLGLLLIFFLSFRAHLFPPPMGQISFSVPAPTGPTGLLLLDSLLAGNLPAFWSALGHVFLPALTLAIGAIAPLTRITRSSMIEVLRSDYIRFSRSLGIAGSRLYYRYGLRNGVIPTVTLTGVIFGYLVGGDVLVEKIFAWPGVGLYAVDSIQYSDYAAIQGFVLVAALLYLTLFLIVDIVYGILDPRVQ